MVVAAEVDEDEVFSWCLAALEPGEEVGAGNGGGRGEGGGEGGVPGRGGRRSLWEREGSQMC